MSRRMRGDDEGRAILEKVGEDDENDDGDHSDDGVEREKVGEDDEEEDCDHNDDEVEKENLFTNGISESSGGGEQQGVCR